MAMQDGTLFPIVERNFSALRGGREGLVLLEVAAPRCFNMFWETLPIRRGTALDSHLLTEKGSPLTPIQLSSLDATTKRRCAIQELVDTWHDEQGLCRALCDAGQAIVLSVPMPVFDSTGPPTAIEYVPCALTFHEGTVSEQGHYRCALRASSTYMLYDDNKIPEQKFPLTLHQHQSIALIWAVQRTLWEENLGSV